MDALLDAIVDDDRPQVKQLLKTSPELATGLIETPRLFQSRIVHWIYAGDTALHLAAAGYRVEIVRLLIAAGADPNATTNHRRSGPAALRSGWIPQRPAVGSETAGPDHPMPARVGRRD